MARKNGGSSRAERPNGYRSAVCSDALPFVFWGGCLLNMDGTLTETSSETPQETTTDTQEGIEYLPPVEPLRNFGQCPRCNRMLKLKTLRYSHYCARSFDPTQRAIEQQVLADKAVNDRMASLEQRATPHAEMQRQAKHITTQTRDFSKLMCFT